MALQVKNSLGALNSRYRVLVSDDDTGFDNIPKKNELSSVVYEDTNGHEMTVPQLMDFAYELSNLVDTAGNMIDQL